MSLVERKIGKSFWYIEFPYIVHNNQTGILEKSDLVICNKTKFRSTSMSCFRRPVYLFMIWLSSPYDLINGSVSLLSTDFFTWLGRFSRYPWNVSHVHLSRARRKSALGHAQNVRIYIILRMRKVLSGHLVSIDTFYSFQQCLQRTAKALLRLQGCAGWSWPSLSVYARTQIFAWRGPTDKCHFSSATIQI